MNKLPFRPTDRSDPITNTIFLKSPGVPELHLPNKNLVFGKIKDGTNPSQPVGAWYRENRVQRQVHRVQGSRVL